MAEAVYMPPAGQALGAAVDRIPALCARLDETLDWIEADPPDIQARRRAWAAGKLGVEVTGGGEEYLIVWENTKPRPTVWYIRDPSSLAR